MNIDWAIKATDVVIIVTSIAGPILAVWASDIRAQRKADRDRKEWVFRTLMSTRTTKLDQGHVSAINHIEFAFPKSQFPKIEEARGLYRKHLRKTESASNDAAVRKSWDTKAIDLFSDLLHEMAAALGLQFTKNDIAEESYIPDAYLLGQAERRQIQSLALEVLRDGRALNITVHVPNQDAK